MTTYDPHVLKTYADKLYAQAKFVALKYFFGLGILTLFLLELGSSMTSVRLPAESIFGLSLIIGLIGAGYGYEKSFMLRLEAQRTLCQLEIEKNTRQQVSVKAASVGTSSI